ncbi:MAG: class I SAM-dependent rRNA methyltransferase [Patescibacteria group bacterium]|nr:class I SAM-dependent rRNA methyltransferase [Patescibacteria group bacterium]
MNQINEIWLKPGKEIPILAGHPWIFSNAIDRDIQGENGQIVKVKDGKGRDLGLGTWNGLTSIRVRMLTRDQEEKIDVAFFVSRFKELDGFKKSGLPKTTGYRVVHAEADGIPGLILDRYDDVFVFQLHTAGMDKLRAEIIEAIRKTFKPSAIIERSDLDVRKLEGLTNQPVEIHHGKIDEPVVFQENGIDFYADVLHGQKTGFFLDQRDARLAVGQLANGKRVLNLFGYTGAFSVHAALGGAIFVATVDVSRQALETAQKNFEINKLDPEDENKFLFLEANVMDLLRDREIPGSPYDLIVCDPPAFAKSEKHMPQAIKAYTDLNADCLQQLGSGGILVTSSCSGRVTPEDFRNMLRLAAGHAQKDVRVLRWISQPIDHAERLAFPEGRYLKTAVLEVI